MWLVHIKPGYFALLVFLDNFIRMFFVKTLHSEDIFSECNSVQKTEANKCKHTKNKSSKTRNKIVWKKITF